MLLYLLIINIIISRSRWTWEMIDTKLIHNKIQNEWLNTTNARNANSTITSDDTKKQQINNNISNLINDNIVYEKPLDYIYNTSILVDDNKLDIMSDKKYSVQRIPIFACSGALITLHDL